MKLPTHLVYLDQLLVSQVMHGSDSASASSLGISSNRPRTISLWIQAEQDEMKDAVIYGLGNLSGNSGGNNTGWGLRNIWYKRMGSFYNNQSNKDDFNSQTGDFGGNWKHVAHAYDK